MSGPIKRANNQPSDDLIKEEERSYDPDLGLGSDDSLNFPPAKKTKKVAMGENENWQETTEKPKIPLGRGSVNNFCFEVDLSKVKTKKEVDDVKASLESPPGIEELSHQGNSMSPEKFSSEHDDQTTENPRIPLGSGSENNFCFEVDLSKVKVKKEDDDITASLESRPEIEEHSHQNSSMSPEKLRSECDDQSSDSDLRSDDEECSSLSEDEEIKELRDRLEAKMKAKLDARMAKIKMKMKMTKKKTVRSPTLEFDEEFQNYEKTHKEKQKKSYTEGLTSGKIDKHVENLMFRRSKRRNLQSHRNMLAKERQEQLAIIWRKENKIIEKYRTSDQRKRYVMTAENWIYYGKHDSAFRLARVRAFLILEILLFGRGTDMESICDLTVEEFLNGTPDGDGFTFSVKCHKKRKQDTVYIYVDKSLYNMINIFYHGIRKEIQFKPTFHCQYMFCTVSGHHLTSITASGICGIINRFIKDNDLGNVRITTSDIPFIFSNWSEGNS